MQMVKKLRSIIAKIYMYNLFVWWHQKGRVEVVTGGGGDGQKVQRWGGPLP